MGAALVSAIALIGAPSVVHFQLGASAPATVVRSCCAAVSREIVRFLHRSPLFWNLKEQIWPASYKDTLALSTISGSEKFCSRRALRPVACSNGSGMASDQSRKLLMLRKSLARRGLRSGNWGINVRADGGS